MNKLVGSILFFFCISAAAAFAAETFGVALYPGAKYDAAATRALKDLIGSNGVCYRTSDSIPKVTEFYKKKGLNPFRGGTPERVTLQNSTGLNIELQNPWMEVSTGKMVQGTLISIIPGTHKGEPR